MELDGYSLLQLCKMDHPDDVYEIKLMDKGFTHVNAVDMREFRGVIFIDASGNYLNIKDVSYFPSLEKCYLALNEINDLNEISPTSLKHLRLLDLSFNYLNITCFKTLHLIPSLVHLDLSNNAINHIPKDIDYLDLPCLQTLSLRGNILKDLASLSYLIQALSHLQSLRQLDLSHCELISLPAFSTVRNNGPSFPKLSLLNLAHNNLSANALHALIEVVNLKYLDLRHNTACIDEINTGNASLITDILVQSCGIVVAIYDPSDVDTSDCSHLLEPSSSNNTKNISPSSLLLQAQLPVLLSDDDDGDDEIEEYHVPQWILDESKREWHITSAACKHNIEIEILNNMLREKKQTETRSDKRIPSRIRSRLQQLQQPQQKGKIMKKIQRRHRQRQADTWRAMLEEINIT